MNDAKHNTKSRPAILLCAVVALVLICLGSFLAVWRVVNPADRVRVVVWHFPADVFFQCVAVEDDDGFLSPLYWYVPGIIPRPRPMHPSHCIWSRLDDENKEFDYDKFVQWRKGTRYGVVTLTKDNRWFVYWFSPGSRRDFDLATVKPVPLAPGEVRELGLSGVHVGDSGWDNAVPVPTRKRP